MKRRSYKAIGLKDVSVRHGRVHVGPKPILIKSTPAYFHQIVLTLDDAEQIDCQYVFCIDSCKYYWFDPRKKKWTDNVILAETINATQIAAGAIRASNIAANAVTSQRIAANAVVEDSYQSNRPVRPGDLIVDDSIQAQRIRIEDIHILNEEAPVNESIRERVRNAINGAISEMSRGLFFGRATEVEMEREL